MPSSWTKQPQILNQVRYMNDGTGEFRVHCRDGAPICVPHGFELDSTDREPLAIPVPKRHRIPSLAKPNWRCIASIAARSKTEVRVVISRPPGGGRDPSLE